MSMPSPLKMSAYCFPFHRILYGFKCRPEAHSNSKASEGTRQGQMADGAVSDGTFGVSEKTARPRLALFSAISF